MVITYHGVESFRIKSGDLVLAFNPVSKNSKFKHSRFGADIVLNTINHPDFNGVDSMSLKDKKPFVVSGSGEYEINGIFIKGFISESGYSEENKINTIYSVSLDGMSIGFLGALNTKDIKDNIKSTLSSVDILFVPIGGEGVLNSSDAYNLAVKLDAKIIIPMHYGEVGEKNSLETFLKEGGVDKVAPVEKITLKKKDLVDKLGEIMILKSVNS
ncbi:MBL fold metallo-hydrolase [Patescibacteria group bacterium]